MLIFMFSTEPYGAKVAKGRSYVGMDINLMKVHIQKSQTDDSKKKEKLKEEKGELYDDPRQYRSIDGVLQYLTFTRPVIVFAVNQDLIYWSSRNQRVVAHSSTKAAYRSTAAITSELLGFMAFLLHLVKTSPSASWRKKHIEIDQHFVRENLEDREIEAKFAATENQIVDVIKGINKNQGMKWKTSPMEIFDIILMHYKSFQTLNVKKEKSCIANVQEGIGGEVAT
ncbi:hypothetical protein AMTRI_Chr12g272430 [Amborella trichopoda]